jgi:hypothetical protein
MVGRTVSAYVDDATAARIAHLAKTEDRAPAQIGASALRLYASLPEVAHRALRRLDATESVELSHHAWNSMTRGLLHVLFEDAENRIVDNMRRNGVGDTIGDSEDEILAEAVRLTTQPQ